MDNTVKGLELALELAETHREEHSDLDHFVYTLKELLEQERVLKAEAPDGR